MADNPKVKISNPTCHHVARGFVSWPSVVDIAVGKPHASTHCCDRKTCIEDASLWVEAHTGHKGVFEPFPKQNDNK